MVSVFISKIFKILLMWAQIFFHIFGILFKSLHGALNDIFRIRLRMKWIEWSVNQDVCANQIFFHSGKCRCSSVIELLTMWYGTMNCCVWATDTLISMCSIYVDNHFCWILDRMLNHFWFLQVGYMVCIIRARRRMDRISWSDKPSNHF